MASATPVKVGVVLLVSRSPTTPLSVDTDRAGAVGAVGASVSMVIDKFGELAEVLAATSVAVKR